MKNISIVGYGRFGEILLRLLGDEFELGVYTRSEKNRIRIPAHVKTLTSESEIYDADVIFYCVPISSFEEVIATHSQYFEDRHVLIDVLSVKTHPRDVFERHIGQKKTQAILTHPMFGPDSSKDGFSNLPLIINQFKANEETYNFWKSFFEKKNLHVIEMTPDEHDRQAANSQGLTHFIGRLLQEYGYKPTEIDSLGATKLKEIMDQVCNDTWQLYFDLERFNPYTKEMVKKLDSAFEKIHQKTFEENV